MNVDISALRSQLGPVGVWLASVGGQSAAVERDTAREIEALGFPALWFGEAPFNKEAFAHAGLLLSATSDLVVATGIANVYGRDATSMQLGAHALAEAYPGRFVLGMGVSHAPLVAPRGHDYGKPVSTMRDYLDGMEASPYVPPAPEPPVPVVLAALRPKMLELARERTAGAHPYFVPVAHTERARAALGPDRLLAPELMVVLETNPDRARAIARKATKSYLALPNYANNLRWLGYEDHELAGGGSDRVVDDIVAWGTVDDVRARVQAHLAAGADHVPVQPLGSFDEQLQQLRTLAPVLLDG
ncbi:MAG: class F420-dependent oxidoreductase [Solirubrobacterales bacterium]|nr:class F420-dependent oxidoreductase [Solirubrobacterales bacterium]